MRCCAPAGMRCGRFTSPHLARYNERICVDGVEASDAEPDRIVRAHRRRARRHHAHVLRIQRAGGARPVPRAPRVDVAVLEVGLGGRLDATNIIDADVGVVCSIGLDHVDWLGDSLEDIGREKAGIFRRGRPAVLGSADMPASVWSAIEELGARAGGARPRLSTCTPHGGRLGFRVRRSRAARPAAARARRRSPDRQCGHGAGRARVRRFRHRARRTRTCQRGVARACASRGAFSACRARSNGFSMWPTTCRPREALRANLRHLAARARTLAVCGILGDKDIRGITAALAPRSTPGFSWRSRARAR